MLSVKLLIVNALIENLINLLCLEPAPVFSDMYLEELDRLLHLRRTLRTR